MADFLVMAGTLVFSFAVGYALIRRIPALLHTPLMSMTNAVSAITILGALLLFAEETGSLETALGAAAVALAMFNLAGGLAITDRMLRLFRKARKAGEARAESAGQGRAEVGG